MLVNHTILLKICRDAHIVIHILSDGKLRDVQPRYFPTSESDYAHSSSSRPSLDFLRNLPPTRLFSAALRTYPCFLAPLFGAVISLRFSQFRLRPSFASYFSLFALNFRIPRACLELTWSGASSGFSDGSSVLASACLASSRLKRAGSAHFLGSSGKKCRPLYCFEVRFFAVQDPLVVEAAVVLVI